MKDPRRQLGFSGEELAAAFLKKQGYKILERNYRTPLGELDLVAQHQGQLVFVEIKTRTGPGYGSALEAVHAGKQTRLRKLADYYLKQKRLKDMTVRFDVVGILWEGENPQIEVVQGAF